MPKQPNLDKLMVAISCITYNHEPYIRQCLEGFVMQKTNFKFVAIVHDDASTDGTATIVREYAEKYPDIIKPIYETENQYSKHDGSLGRIMNDAIANTGAKYIALCEGDDYWTDPCKLQKQVDFLEANEGYSLCCHRINLLYGSDLIDKETKDGRELKGDISFTNRENLEYWMTETNSIVLRSNMLDSGLAKKYNYYRDAHLIYHLLRKGKGMYLDFIGGVYRKHIGGIYSSMNDIQQMRIAYLIYRELQQNNLDDKIIQEFFIRHKQWFFNELRLMIGNRICPKGFFKVVGIYASDERKENGWIGWFNCYQKLFKSFVKGLFAKKHSFK